MAHAILNVVDGLGARLVKMSSTELTIGRRNGVDIKVTGAEVSREHCQITVEQDPQVWVLRDKGSRYGTFVNGERVTERVLKDGDVIVLGRGGETEIAFSLDERIDEHIDEHVVHSRLSEPFALRVFVSSTSIDLLDYRHAAFKAVHSFGSYTDDMLFWSADEREPANVSTDRVRDCDVLILLVAHRYGVVPDGSDYSVTEQEYRAARAAQIPVLAFMLDDSVPWPPKHIQYEKIDQLTAFKTKVQKEVTIKTFRTADELTALVTQSLVGLARRRHAAPALKSRRLPGPKLAVGSTADLLSMPDVVVQVGLAEDGLPLALQVKRSHDVGDLLDQLASRVIRPGVDMPEALFASFEQSILNYSRDSWAKERIVTVSMRDGSNEQMYVSRATLSSLFQPLMGAILEAPQRHDMKIESFDEELPAKQKFGRIETTARSLVRSYPTDPNVADASTLKELQSIGGRNRFLGISLNRGTAFCVGTQLGQWVEWRPFHGESLAAGDAVYHLGGRRTTQPKVSGPMSGYAEAVQRHGERFLDDSGVLKARARFTIERRVVAAMIADIARRVAELHQQGGIHGDLKPGNVILTGSGPVLIDLFDLHVGELSPGWTPGWSAPEQVLGQPVTTATDVYPLGIMVSRLLGARLVGEVRKLKTLPTETGVDEFDIFYDPLPHAAWDAASDATIKPWLALVQSCLRFDPAKRVASADLFLERLETLRSESPLPGTVTVTIPGELRAVTIDGVDTMARVVTDSEPTSAPLA